jgi:hypothetical protein
LHPVSIVFDPFALHRVDQRWLAEVRLVMNGV